MSIATSPVATSGDIIIGILIQKISCKSRKTTGRLGRRRVINVLKPHIIAFVLGRGVSMHRTFFLSKPTVNLFTRGKQALTVRTRVMEQQRAELENKWVLSRVSGYMAKVKSLGLEKGGWTVFDVNVEGRLPLVPWEYLKSVYQFCDL